MACNSCTKPFTLLRKEKGCPGCGFSYCSKCLNNKVFLQKLNSEAKVCAKCKHSTQTDSKKREPPDAYYKRMGIMKQGLQNDSTNAENEKDQRILERLQKLKEDHKVPVENEIATRLQNIKGDSPSTSDAELHARLAKLKGTPISDHLAKPTLPTPDLRTEQEQADDLIKQYLEQTKIDTKYKDEFNELVNDVESRLQKLKGSGVPSVASAGTHTEKNVEPEDEEEAIKSIIKKIKSEELLEEFPPPTNDELPFCEICNEDAKLRCVGCQYLFCKGCFQEHKDEDDGCNRYEPYTPPKGNPC